VPLEAAIDVRTLDRRGLAMAHEKNRRRELAVAIAQTLKGSIAILALLAIAADQPISIPDMLLALALTLLSLGLVNGFADVIQNSVTAGRPSTWEELRAIGGKLVWLALPGFIALFVMSLAGLDILSHDLAYGISLWSLVALMFLSGFLSRYLLGAQYVRSLVAGAVVGVLGLFFVVLKVLFK